MPKISISKSFNKKYRKLSFLIFALIIAFWSILTYVIVNKNKILEKFIILEKYHKCEKNNSKKIKIPKIIWQTHKSNDLPESTYNGIKKIIEKNPDYEHNFFTNDDITKFMKDNFDENVLKAYNKINPGAGKADIWRLAVIYKKGGIYIDSDKILKDDSKPFSEIIDEDDEMIHGRGWYIWGNDAPSTNATICAVPNHPIIKKTFYSVIDSINNNKPITQIGNYKGWAELENYTGTPHLWKYISETTGEFKLKEGKYNHGLIISNKIEDQLQQNSNYGNDLKELGVNHWSSQPVFKDTFINIPDNDKICVYTWYDDNIKEYADITYKINKYYCDKNNITFKKLSKRKLLHRKTHWEKIAYLKDIINTNKYKYIMWIDADACFNLECSYDLNTFIKNTFKDNKQFIMPIDTPESGTNKWSINSGVMIFKNSQETKNIIDYWLTDECFNNKIDGFNDQGCIRYTYKINYNDINNKTIFMPHNTLQTFNIIKYSSDVMIFHLAGFNNKTRKNMFNDLYDYYQKTNIIKL